MVDLAKFMVFVTHLGTICLCKKQAPSVEVGAASGGVGIEIRPDGPIKRQPLFWGREVVFL